MTQIAIMLFGASAIWLVGQKEKYKRWGYIMGLLAQPFWYYEAIINQQWGILIMTTFYTYSWIIGIYNYWIYPPNSNFEWPKKALTKIKKVIAGAYEFVAMLLLKY